MSEKYIEAWATRFEDGGLVIFFDDIEPKKRESDGQWGNLCDAWFTRVDFDLPHVKWEDDEAIKIKLEVVEDE